MKLQKQLGDIRDYQEKVLSDITNLTQKGVTTVNLVEGGSDISIMTQLKLRLGEKLADKALAFASNKQEKYQKYQIFGDQLHIILHCLKELGIVLKQL